MRRGLIGILLCLLVLSAGCGGDEMGVEYRGERMPVVDMHLHPGEWSGIPPATQEYLAQRFPFPLGLNPEATAAQVLTGSGILNEMDKAGVSQSLLYAVYAPNTVGIAGNELVAEAMGEDPTRLVGLASLRVDRWTTDEAVELQRLRDALALPGMVGIKLAHSHMAMRFDDARYDSIYQLAGELDAPVYLHTGPSPFPGSQREPAYTDPAYAERSIAAFPGTDFILGHMGYDFENKLPGALETCLQLASDYPNVYLEPSALGSSGSDPTDENLPLLLRRVREEGLVGRMIYGSDGPQGPGFVAEYLERTLHAMEQSDYSADEARAFLYQNFAALFDVAEVEL